MFYWKGPWSIAMVPKWLLIYHCAPCQKETFVRVPVHSSPWTVCEALTGWFWQELLCFLPEQSSVKLSSFWHRFVSRPETWRAKDHGPQYSRSPQGSHRFNRKESNQQKVRQVPGKAEAKHQPSVCGSIPGSTAIYPIINQSIFFHFCPAKHGCSLPMQITCLLKLPHFNLQLY